MTRVIVIDTRRTIAPVDWWQWITIALAVTVLCSCSTVPNVTQRVPSDHAIQLRSPKTVAAPAQLAPVVTPDRTYDADPLELIGGESILIDDCDVERLWSEPQSTVVICPSAEVLATYPRDEYLCDGGDGLYRGSLDASDQRGIEPSDTIAQFDSQFSRGNVVASNRVCIYAPRFASTRKIINVRHEEMLERVGGLHERTRATAKSIPTMAADVTHDLGLEGQISETINHQLQDARRGLLLDDVAVLAEASRRAIPFESRGAVEAKQFDGHQQLSSEQLSVTTLQWTNIDSVELAIDGRAAYSVRNVGPPSSIYTYEVNRSEPQLRLEKIVSTDAAQPGDTIVITIHYQNIGETPIENLRIVDNLATRFEFIADSNESSRRSLFSTTDNSVGSTKLVWEVRETIDPQEDGEVQFRCKIR